MEQCIQMTDEHRLTEAEFDEACAAGETLVFHFSLGAIEPMRLKFSGARCSDRPGWITGDGWQGYRVGSNGYWTREEPPAKPRLNVMGWVLCKSCGLVLLGADAGRDTCLECRAGQAPRVCAHCKKRPAYGNYDDCEKCVAEHRLTYHRKSLSLVSAPTRNHHVGPDLCGHEQPSGLPCLQARGHEGVHDFEPKADPYAAHRMKAKCLVESGHGIEAKERMPAAYAAKYQTCGNCGCTITGGVRLVAFDPSLGHNVKACCSICGAAR